MTGYKVTIRESSRPLTVKEKLAVKDFSAAVSIDAAIEGEGSLLIAPDYYAILDVHNERSKNEKDYVKYVVVDKSGVRYTTGSESFFSSFSEIAETMAADAPDEEYNIECFRKPSKNYAGKTFITCTIA